MSLLDVQEDIIIDCKNKLDELIGHISGNLNARQKLSLSSINKLIENLEVKIIELVMDIKTNNPRNITPELLYEIKQYIMDEQVKQAFLPYMIAYKMRLETTNNLQLNRELPGL